MSPGEALELGRQAAFHGPPVVGIAPLQALLTTPMDPGALDEARWLLAICQGASGLFGSALDSVTRLGDESDYVGRGHLVAGSVHRQLGNFDRARDHDNVALASESQAVRCEAHIGLAADAVGVGAADAAAAHLSLARQVWQPDWWREGIRLEWVSAEHALLAGRPATALAGLRRARDAAQEHDAPRHLAKTTGFLAVAAHSDQPDDPAVADEAMVLLVRATEAAQTLAAWPLVWAFSRLQWLWLEQRHGDGSATAARAWGQAARAVSVILSDLPAQMRPAFRRRPDVADLLDYAG